MVVPLYEELEAAAYRNCSPMEWDVLSPEQRAEVVGQYRMRHIIDRFVSEETYKEANKKRS